jgi:hypothetical protein
VRCYQRTLHMHWVLLLFGSHGDDSIRFLWRGRRPVSMNGVSIIKPLLDKQPDLRANLQSFFNLAESSPTLVRGVVIFLGFCAFRSAFLPLSFTFSLRAD